MARTLILGGGFGGLTVATELRRLLGEEHEVVLVDRSEHFSMGLRKLWELVGVGTIAEGSRSRDLLRDRGVDVLRDEITAIDAGARAATVGGRTVEADYLVVALGASPRPDLVDGLTEHGHDVWDVAGVSGAARALADFDGGRILVVVAGAPYTCPPAPYECAMHVDEHLRARGIREQTELSVSTAQPMLMPAAGEAASAWMTGQLTKRGIRTQAGRPVERVEAGSVRFQDSSEPFDLLIAVPPHRVPAVVAESGLAGEGGWISVDPGSLETEHANVFAIGDVTQIPLAHGLPIPKAGVIAELEGERVAGAIAARVHGAWEPPPFDGTAFCYVEMGPNVAARIDANFYATPAPSVSMQEPGPDNAAEKRRFELERLERWFGG